MDGGCLRSTIRQFCRELFADVHAYQPFVPGLVGAYDKVFYYDAVPGRGHNETQAAYEARVQPDHERLASIQALDRVHVALGQIVGQDRRQKGVDVRLAVDMMTHAFRGNVSRVTLFAGDADFFPLVQSLVGEGLHVTLWHPPQANTLLKGAADTNRAFTFSTNHHCLTSDGLQAAFQVQSQGGGGSSEITPKWESDEFAFAGKWSESQLTIWRRNAAGSWAYINMKAPGASLARALIAFDAIFSWGVASTGEQWIEAI